MYYNIVIENRKYQSSIDMSLYFPLERLKQMNPLIWLSIFYCSQDESNAEIAFLDLYIGCVIISGAFLSF
jgi:hypothetical protein